MRIGLAGALGAALAMLGTASPVFARQEAAPTPQAEEDPIAQISGAFVRLSETLGYTVPPPPEAEFRAALTAALPNRPEGDTRTWGNAFDINIEVNDDTALTDARYDDIVDARSCHIGERGRAVVDYRRIERHGLSGYQCSVVHIGDGEGEDVWVLQSTAMVQRGPRSVIVQYAGLLAIGGDPEATRLLGEDRLGANVGLAGALTDYVIDAWGQASASQGSPDVGAMSERLLSTLEEIGDDMMNTPQYDEEATNAR